jgi:hypothetical protein
MCEVDAALFVLDPSFVRCILGTLAFAVASAGLAFVQFGMLYFYLLLTMMYLFII